MLGQQSLGSSPMSQRALKGQVGTGYWQGEEDWAQASQGDCWGLDGPVRELSVRQGLLGTAGVARLEAGLGLVLGSLARGPGHRQAEQHGQAAASGGAVEAPVLVQVEAFGLYSAWAGSALLLLGGQEDGRPSGTAS